jgi:hypothetical protein
MYIVRARRDISCNTLYMKLLESNDKARILKFDEKKLPNLFSKLIIISTTDF